MHPSNYVQLKGGRNISQSSHASSGRESRCLPNSDQDLWQHFDNLNLPCINTNMATSGQRVSAIIKTNGGTENEEPLLFNCKQSLDERRRSGSWTGVQESDEEIENIRKERVPSPSGTESSTAQTNSVGVSMGEEYQASYQNSCGTENQVNHSADKEKMRRKLRYFFMNPIEKWQAKGRIPWKLLVQIIKIIIVTLQLSMFASQRYNHVSYLSDTKVSFSHLFIKGWDATREVDAYPPSSGPLALYKISDFYEFIDYSVETFNGIENSALGTYKYERDNGTVRMPTFCFTQFKNCTIDLYNLKFVLDKDVEQICIDVPLSVLDDKTPFSLQTYLENSREAINFDTMLDAVIRFDFRTIKLTVDLPFDSPECYQLKYMISFNNHDHDGQMLIESDVTADVLQCKGYVDSVDETYQYNYIRGVLNILTIIICSLSLVMCLRSLIRAQQLRKVTCSFFAAHFHRHLTFEERFKFTNLWYVLICVNDLLIITGSLIKIALEGEDYEGYLDRWNACSLFLGIGNMLVWFGCLRYLCFFETYNVMILTLKHCFSKVVRYSICIMMVFGGYSFCGWLILGPYHLKFRSWSSTVECLFSIMNGDDMFATFAMLDKRDAVIWYFSRLYLYSFVSLFIYVILSLFIAIIMDSYETIKKYYENGFPMCDLLYFAHSCEAHPASDAYRDDQDSSIQDMVNNFFCCPFGCVRPVSQNSQYQPLPP